jgi:hypothetical protein
VWPFLHKHKRSNDRNYKFLSPAPEEKRARLAINDVMMMGLPTEKVPIGVRLFSTRSVKADRPCISKNVRINNRVLAVRTARPMARPSGYNPVVLWQTKMSCQETSQVDYYLKYCRSCLDGPSDHHPPRSGKNTKSNRSQSWCQDPVATN